MLGRDFAADGPWQKMGTDVTEFKCSFGKAYLAPAYDFGSEGKSPPGRYPSRRTWRSRTRMLGMLIPWCRQRASTVMQSDMGWQYQSAGYVELRGAGFVQSMSRKKLPGQRLHRGAVRTHEG